MEEEFLRLNSFIESNCENLWPNVLPNGFSNPQVNLKPQNQGDECFVKNCNKKHSGKILRLWKFNPKKMNIELYSHGLSCEFCSKVSHLESFLCNNKGELVEHFMEVNRIGSEECFALEDIHKVQEIYSVSYSLKVLLSKAKERIRMDLKNHEIKYSSIDDEKVRKKRKL